MNEKQSFTLDQKLKALELAVKISAPPVYSNPIDGSTENTDRYLHEIGTFLVFYRDVAKVILKEMDSL